jgi:hypothetical protein
LVVVLLEAQVEKCVLAVLAASSAAKNWMAAQSRCSPFQMTQVAPLEEGTAFGMEAGHATAGENTQ